MKTAENRDGWTPERDGLLTKLWDEGLTGSQIAMKMRTTRSAILARARRIRLKSRVSVETKASTRKPRKKPNITKFNFASGREAGREPLATIAKEPYVHRETVVTPEDQRIAFEALKEFDKRCRYPHGDEPPFMYCGAKAVPGQPWCPTHFKACAPALAAKHEAAQLSGKTGELEQPQNLRQLEGVA